jgi:3-oxoacyl-[acyl-carrier-protein] synthase-1
VITRACAPVTGAGRRATDVYCDLNGERGRAAEYGFAMLKLAPVLVNSSEFVSPADCWGDVGAASGALLMIAALSAGRRGWSRGGDAVVWCASETGERAAALIATGAPEVGRALCL